MVHFLDRDKTFSTVLDRDITFKTVYQVLQHHLLISFVFVFVAFLLLLLF